MRVNLTHFVFFYSDIKALDRSQVQFQEKLIIHHYCHELYYVILFIPSSVQYYITVDFVVPMLNSYISLL